MVNEIKIDTIQLDKFEVMLINSSPPRIEAKLEFDKQHAFQKLFFSLMSISHNHGFGCSAPFFGEKEEKSMSFLIGTVVSSKRSVAKVLKRLHACLVEIVSFSEAFISQLDFSKIDLSMFEGFFIADVEKIVSLKDQFYGGSWQELKDSLEKDGLADAIGTISALEEFERVNEKDLGLVAHKLSSILQTMFYREEDLSGTKGTVLN